MSTSLEMSEVYRLVFDAMEQNRSAGAILAQLAENTGLSFFVTGVCGEITTDCISDDAKIAAEKVEFIKKCITEKVQEMICAGAETGKLELCEVCGLKALFQELGSGADSIGYLVVVADCDVDDADLNMFGPLVKRALAMASRGTPKVRSEKSLPAKQLVERALLKKDKDEDEVKVQEQVYLTYLEAPYVLVVIRNEDPDKAAHIPEEVRRRYPTALVYCDKDEIAVLVMGMDGPDKREKLLHELSCFLEPEFCRYTVSEPIVERDAIALKRKVMDRLFEMCEDRGCISEYDHYLELVASYAANNIGTQVFGGRYLREVRKEEETRGNELYTTLKAYLLAGNNVNLAAQNLFIHRNTMIYRLSKIQTMIPYDINDPMIAKRLMVSILILEQL